MSELDAALYAREVERLTAERDQAVAATIEACARACEAERREVTVTVATGAFERGFVEGCLSCRDSIRHLRSLPAGLDPVTLEAAAAVCDSNSNADPLWLAARIRALRSFSGRDPK